MPSSSLSRKNFLSLRPSARSLSPTSLLLTVCILFIAWEHLVPNIPPLAHLALYPPIPTIPLRTPAPFPVDPDLPARVARQSRPMPACAASGKRAVSFFLLFMGHSGSTAIMSELRSHSDVLIETTEPVDHQKVFNTTEALIIARRLLQRGRDKGFVVGFKIRPMHILAAPEKWRALAAEFETRIIWQYRQNLFKATVGDYSYLVLNDTSVLEGFRRNVSRAERCNIGAGCKYKINDFNFIHRMLRSKLRSQNAITQAVHAMAEHNGCVRELPYEDYLYDRENSITDLQRFLGLKVQKTEPGRFKVTSDSMCDVVENWDELCRLFYGCSAWQHMMNDVRNRCFCRYSTGPTTYCESGDPHAKQR